MDVPLTSHFLRIVRIRQRKKTKRYSLDKYQKIELDAGTSLH